MYIFLNIPLSIILCYFTFSCYTQYNFINNNNNNLRNNKLQLAICKNNLEGELLKTKQTYADMETIRKQLELSQSQVT